MKLISGRIKPQHYLVLILLFITAGVLNYFYWQSHQSTSAVWPATLLSDYQKIFFSVIQFFSIALFKLLSLFLPLHLAQNAFGWICLFSSLMVTFFSFLRDKRYAWTIVVLYFFHPVLSEQAYAGSFAGVTIVCFLMWLSPVLLLKRMSFVVAFLFFMPALVILLFWEAALGLLARTLHQEALKKITLLFVLTISIAGTSFLLKDRPLQESGAMPILERHEVVIEVANQFFLPLHTGYFQEKQSQPLKYNWTEDSTVTLLVLTLILMTHVAGWSQISIRFYAMLLSTLILCGLSRVFPYFLFDFSYHSRWALPFICALGLHDFVVQLGKASASEYKTSFSKFSPAYPLILIIFQFLFVYPRAEGEPKTTQLPPTLSTAISTLPITAHLSGNPVFLNEIRGKSKVSMTLGIKDFFSVSPAIWQSQQLEVKDYLRVLLAGKFEEVASYREYYGVTHLLLSTRFLDSRIEGEMLLGEPFAFWLYQRLHKMVPQKNIWQKLQPKHLFYQDNEWVIVDLKKFVEEQP